MIRRILLAVGCLIAVLLCLPALPPLGHELVRRLPFGWMSFVRRTLPEVTWNWSGAGMVLLSSIVLLAGLHSLCGWVYRAARGADARREQRWRWRWTGALFAAFWLLFALVLGASGLRQHLVWLSEFDAPLYTERRSGWAEIKQADGALATALLESTNAALAYAVFRRGEYESIGRSPTLWEEHHVLMFTNTNGRLVGYLLFPRHPAIRDRIGIYACGEGIPRETSATNLPAVIARLEALARQPEAR